MQIVIDIDDIIYKDTIKNKILSIEYVPEIAIAIATGTPLPKGHGRLIDADVYRKEMLESVGFNFFGILDQQLTIIEADKEEN